MTLGDRLKQRRHQVGLTQDELAQRAAVRRGTIADLEINKRIRVSSDTLKKLAKALGCTSDYLVGMYDEESERTPTATALVGA